jgi:hypothetical protein
MGSFGIAQRICLLLELRDAQLQLQIGGEVRQLLQQFPRRGMAPMHPALFPFLSVVTSGSARGR